ncbi:MAG TPA: universal stress protein [Gemmatimonadaceae bacterium]
MYKRILVPLEHTNYDVAIIDHVRALARFCGASVVLIHVADGFAARNVNQLKLRESEEMRLDREYIERTCESLTRDGIETDAVLAGGDPAREIADAAAREGCDLIAMSTHGHRFIKDMIYGSVANEVRHLSKVPVLVVRGERRGTPRDVSAVDVPAADKPSP